MFCFCFRFRKYLQQNFIVTTIQINAININAQTDMILDFILKYYSNRFMCITKLLQIQNVQNSRFKTQTIQNSEIDDLKNVILVKLNSDLHLTLLLHN